MPSGAASAKPAYARVHRRRAAFAAAVSDAAVQGPGPVIRTRARSSGVSADAGSRSSPRSIISVRCPTEGVIPAASSSRRPTVSPSAGGGVAGGRSASVTRSAIRRRASASCGTDGGGSPAPVFSPVSHRARRAAPSASGATPRARSRASASSSRRRAASASVRASATEASSPPVRCVVAALWVAAPSADRARAWACQASAVASAGASPDSVTGCGGPSVLGAAPALVAPATGPGAGPSGSPLGRAVRAQVPVGAGCPSGPGSIATVYVPVAGSRWRVVAPLVVHQLRAELRAPSSGRLPADGRVPAGLPCGTTATTSVCPALPSNSASRKTSSPNCRAGTAAGAGPGSTSPSASPSAT